MKFESHYIVLTIWFQPVLTRKVHLFLYSSCSFPCLVVVPVSPYVFIVCILCCLFVLQPFTLLLFYFLFPLPSFFPPFYSSFSILFSPLITVFAFSTLSGAIWGNQAREHPRGANLERAKMMQKEQIESLFSGVFRIRARYSGIIYLHKLTHDVIFQYGISVNTTWVC